MFTYNGALDVQQGLRTVDQNKSTRVVVCLRCRLEVTVTTDSRGVKLSYDIEHWIKRCCCNHRASPADCCSFL